VSGHEFTHVGQRKQKKNSLLPQARRVAQPPKQMPQRNEINGSRLPLFANPETSQQITLNSSQHFIGEWTTQAQHKD
jgi:hypothetical protein